MDFLAFLTIVLIGLGGLSLSMTVLAVIWLIGSAVLEFFRFCLEKRKTISPNDF